MTIPHTPENRDLMMKVAEKLQGTCNITLDEALQEVFGDDQLDLSDIAIELLQDLDDQVMECQACNWWCETHELDDDQVCDDCRK